MSHRRALALLAITTSAHAVVVRGRVTSPLGAPLPGARIQLISLSTGPRNAASAISGAEGEYEIRTDLAGRFLLLTSPSPVTPLFAPQVGLPFYAGRLDLLTREIVLDLSAITPQLTSQQTLLPTPLAQLSAPVTQVSADQLLTDATPLGSIAQTPGAFLLQRGQVGTPATLYLRGAPVTSTIIDNVTAQPLGAPYNLGTLTTSGLSAIASTPALELTPTPDPLRFLDGQAGTLSLTTALGQTLHPALTYSGDAGNLSSTRNEAILSATHTRADALASFARFNTDNDQPAAPLHLITWAANLGYHISPETSLRLTLRQDVTAIPLSLPFGIYQLQPAGREAAQNLVAGLTYETRTAGDWHNLLRYGMVRERAQQFHYASPATGLPVTIVGANGYSASGVAAFPAAAARRDLAINRDEYTYQTDYPLRRAAHTSLLALFTARYQDDRALDRQAFPLVTARTTLERSHISFGGSLQGEVRHRLFAQASGFLDHSELLGLRGSPRLGVTWVPVRPGSRRLRGTALHFTVGSGLREPTLAEQIATSSPQVPHARTLDLRRRPEHPGAEARPARDLLSQPVFA